MSINKYVKYFLIILVLVIIGWFIYRWWFRPKVVPIQQPESIPDSSDSPPTSETKVKSSTSSSDEEDEPKPDKWKDFIISKKLNKAKINNDIAIDTSNIFNQDYRELFHKPFQDENHENLYKLDKIKSSFNVNNFDYDLFTSSEEQMDLKEFDINKLDDIPDFALRIKNIETSIKNEPIEELPKITLIDNEVFGW